MVVVETPKDETLTPRIDQILSVSEVAQWLKMKPSTIYQWASSRYIPHVQFKRSLRFIKRNLEEWIMTHFKKPLPAEEKEFLKMLFKAPKRSSLNIDQVVKKNIACAKGIRYTPSRRNQERPRASERRETMGLYKRGRTWWMRFTFQGRQIRRSTKTTDRKLAERIYYKTLGEIAEGKWFEKVPGEEKTFEEMMEKYLREHAAVNKTLSSYIRDKSLAGHLIEAFGGLKLVEIKPNLISSYKAKRRQEGAAPKTINNELILMGHAFNVAIREWEWVKDNPVRRIAKEKVDNLIERWLTPEEEKKLLAASPKWLQEIILFALETGLRQSEILNLQWSNVDLFKKTLSITEQKNKGKDTLPLNSAAMEILKARAKVRHIKSNFVFSNRKGARIDARNLIRAFKRAVKASGIAPCRFHDLRHTFATRLVQAGVDIYTVQKLGRWKNISMVMRYAHHYPESLRSGVEALDKLREKISTNLAQSKEKGVATDSQPLDLIGSGG